MNTRCWCSADQHITDEQQIAFSGMFGTLETTIKAYRPGHKPRLDLHISDVSNLDEQNRVLAADDRRRMNGLGNRLWHTDSSFKAVPARYSLLSARSIPGDGGETQFADMRAAYDALPDAMKVRLEGVVAEHSVLYSRSTIGFTDFSDEERGRLQPVPQLLVRQASWIGAPDAVSGVTCGVDPRHADTGGTAAAARPDGACDATGVCLYAPVACRRSGDVG